MPAIQGSGSTLRLATSSGQREPDWQLTLEQNPLYAQWVAQLRATWRSRERPDPPPRTTAPDRRLLLVVSHGLPPDALDRYFEGAERAYPHLWHWIVQIKQTVRERDAAGGGQ